MTGSLLESLLIYKPDLLEVLKDLSSIDEDIEVRKVSFFLIDIFLVDMKLKQNYFGLSDDIGRLSFLPDDKVSITNTYEVGYKEIIINKNFCEIFNIPQIGLVFNLDNIENVWTLVSTYIGKKITTNDFYKRFNVFRLQNVKDPSIYILSFINTNNIFNKGIYPLYKSDVGEGSIKIGRMINSLSIENPRYAIKTSDIEKFVNAFTSNINFQKESFDNISIVSGEDIRKWYLFSNYYNDKGQLGASCMRYERCQKYLDIYVDNPDVCQLIILKQDDKLIGRALLWTDIDGKKYMDRVYISKDSYVSIFNKYFKSIKDSKFINYEDINIKIGNKDYDYYPYLDSLRYLKYIDGYAILSNKVPTTAYLRLDETDGRFVRFKYS